MNPKQKFSFSRFVPLLIILVAIMSFFYFHLFDYLSFKSLQAKHQLLLQWMQTHYSLAVLIYCLVYTVLVTISVPGASILTMAGGYFFGLLAGTVYVVVSATIGATLLFLAVKTPLGSVLSTNTSSWINRFERGFQKNAFNYLLFLRLVPLFPFWVINIIPALLNIPLMTFVVTTFFGIIPGSLIYVWLGTDLQTILQTKKPLHADIIFTPNFLLPLIALGILALAPILYKKIRGSKEPYHE